MRRAEAKKRGEQVSSTKGKKVPNGKPDGVPPPNKQQRADKRKKEAEARTLFKEGRVVHRTEPELKTHTSYLVFAVLPREWSAEDEDKAKKKWGSSKD